MTHAILFAADQCVRINETSQVDVISIVSSSRMGKQEGSFVTAAM